MIDDWQDRSLVQAWSHAVGEFGDIFQATITNPLILGACHGLKAAGPWSPEIQKTAYDWVRQEAQVLDRAHPDSAVAAWHVAQGGRSLEGWHVVDLGCGEGYMSRLLARQKAICTAVDVSDEMLCIARQRAVHAGVSDRLTFVQADFDREQGATALQSVFQQLAQRPNLVLCTAVLDHLYAPEHLLRSLRRWTAPSDQGPEIPTLVTTLNPEFFLGPNERRLDSRPLAQPRRVSLGPANGQVDIIPRWWDQYEGMFAREGFWVAWCCPYPLWLAPTWLQDRYLREARLPGTVHPGAGPFVYWLLLPRPLGRTVPVEEFLPDVKEIPGQRDDYGGSAKRASPILNGFVVVYGNGSLVLPAHNVGGSLFVVRRGTLALHRRANQAAQSFAEGDILGELESAGDFMLSRYLYDVYAGKSGAEVAEIPPLAAKRLLGHLNDTLSGRLFGILRDRMSRYAWMYHRPSRRQGKIKVVRSGRSRDINERRLQIMCRGLLFASALEHTDPSVGTSGLMICATPTEIYCAITEDVVSTERGKDPHGVSGVMKSLCGMGLIDAFDGEALHDVDNTRRVALGNIYTRCAALLLQHAGNQRAIEDWSTHRLNKALWSATTNRRLVEGSLLADPLAISAVALDIAESLARSASREIGTAVTHEDVFRVIANIAILRDSLEFSHGLHGLTFVHIHDLGLVRRLATDPAGWAGVVQQRHALGTVDGETKASRLGFQESRAKAYLHRVVGFADEYWSQSRDITRTLEEHLGISSFVSRYVAQCKDRLG